MPKQLSAPEKRYVCQEESQREGATGLAPPAGRPPKARGPSPGPLIYESALRPDVQYSARQTSTLLVASTTLSPSRGA